jgi:hypothetical protein
MTVLSPFVNKHVTTKTKLRGNGGTAPRILTLSISHRKWIPQHFGGSTFWQRASGILDRKSNSRYGIGVNRGILAPVESRTPFF